MRRVPGRRVLAGAIAVAGMCVGWTVPGEAAPVTFEFTGSVTSVRPDDPFGGTITVETEFKGFYTFSSTSNDQDSDSRSGSYTSSGSPYGITLNFDGGPGFHIDDYFNIHVLNSDRPSHGDRYSVRGCGDSCGNLEIGFSLFDSSLRAFSSDALPLDAPLLSLFESTMLQFRGNQNGQAFVVLGKITGLRTCAADCDGNDPGPDPAPVPEPGTLLLLAPALAFLGRRSLTRHS